VGVAAERAEIVLHLTEWADYRAIDPAALAAVITHPVLIDARYALDAELWLAASWRVRVLGRPKAMKPTSDERINTFPTNTRSRRRRQLVGSQYRCPIDLG
jgi:UDPglucose 6-dehydrogenase